MTAIPLQHSFQARLAKVLTRPKATTGIRSWFTTVDHKKIGILYGATALIFFVIAGSEALLIRLQLLAPDGTVLTASTYNTLFTMHGTTMVFMVGMPMAVAFGNYLVPLMIGARDVAFPRINMLGYWIFVFGALFIYSGWFLGGLPDGGWFGYTPLTSTPISQGFLPGRGPDFWTVGLIIMGIGSTTSALNMIVTILNMRAPGMRLMRMPIFVWMMLIIGFLTLFAMPCVTAALMMVYSDRNFLTSFFNPAGGGDPLLYQHLFWLFGHPEVYILILPGMGIVSEILPVFSRKPLFGYSVVVFSGIAIGLFGWGVWAHHMFATGLGSMAVGAFGVATMAIAVPTGVKIFNWVGTIWGGAIRFTTAMLYSVGFIVMFTIGGLSGVMHAIVASDTQQTDTYFVVAHFHYVLFGGLVFAIFGGMHYWWPKVFGHFLSEKLGKVTFWVMMVGFNLTFFPMHFAGLWGQPRRGYTYPAGLGVETMNRLSTLGGFIVALATLMFVINVLVSRKHGAKASADPWDARTLEWSIPSPAPYYNFVEVPTVTQLDDYWHQKYQANEDGRLVRIEGSGANEQPAVDPSTVDVSGMHLPDPSYFPLVLAAGLPILGYSFIYDNALLRLAGAVVILAGVIGWGLEPYAEEH